MAARFITVRHGETDLSQEDRFRGHIDIDLNTTGIVQAKATALRLKDSRQTVIYSSPLRRAMHTAEIVARHTGATVEPLQDVNDVDFGAWQGLTMRQAAERDPLIMQQWIQHPAAVTFPGGEALQAVYERAGHAADRLNEEHPDQTVIIVSHAAVCRVLILHLLGLDISHYWKVTQNNCAICIFEDRNSRLVAARINDTCHLKGITSR